jgi:hypothetical protein
MLIDRMRQVKRTRGAPSEPRAGDNEAAGALPHAGRVAHIDCRAV